MRFTQLGYVKVLRSEGVRMVVNLSVSGDYALHR